MTLGQKVIPMGSPDPTRVSVSVTLDGMVRLHQGDWQVPLDSAGADHASRQLKAAAAQARHITMLHRQMPVGLDEEGKIKWLTERLEQ